MELDASCLCVSQDSYQPWSVDIDSRDFSGETDVFWGRLEPFYSTGDFDVAHWKYTKDISGKLFPLEVIKLNGSPPVVRSHFAEIRHAMRNLLHLHFEEDAESLLLALFLGDKSSLNKSVKRAFSNGGIAHVLGGQWIPHWTCRHDTAALHSEPKEVGPLFGNHAIPGNMGVCLDLPRSHICRASGYDEFSLLNWNLHAALYLPLSMLVNGWIYRPFVETPCRDGTGYTT